MSVAASRAGQQLAGVAPLEAVLPEQVKTEQQEEPKAQAGVALVLKMRLPNQVGPNSSRKRLRAQAPPEQLSGRRLGGRPCTPAAPRRQRG